MNESLKPSAERREQSETKAEGKRPRERFTHCAATQPRRTAANNNREGRGSNRRCAHPERKNGAECGRKGAIREAHTHRAREGRTHTMRDMNAQTRATTQRERERETRRRDHKHARRDKQQDREGERDAGGLSWEKNRFFHFYKVFFSSLRWLGPNSFFTRFGMISVHPMTHHFF